MQNESICPKRKAHRFAHGGFIRQLSWDGDDLTEIAKRLEVANIEAIRAIRHNHLRSDAACAHSRGEETSENQ